MTDWKKIEIDLFAAVKKLPNPLYTLDRGSFHFELNEYMKYENIFIDKVMNNRFELRCKKYEVGGVKTDLTTLHTFMFSSDSYNLRIINDFIEDPIGAWPMLWGEDVITEEEYEWGIIK